MVAVAAALARLDDGGALDELLRARERARRARRFELHHWRRTNAGKLNSAGAASCLRSFDDVTGTVSAEGRAHVAGVQRCGSIWSCPVCGPTVRERRAQDIDDAAAEWIKRGGSVWLVTFTVPHARGDGLAQVMDRLLSMYQWAWGGRAGLELRKALGVTGTIRAWDLTWGEAHGWHPHFHVLFFVRHGDPFVPKMIGDRWRAAFVREGIGDSYVPRVSVDVRKVRRNESASAQYLAKADGGWGAGLELARSDLKRGQGLTPAQLLELASSGEAVWVRRWAEYEAATKGRRCIQWTPRLRDFLGLGDELTDQEAAEGPAPEVVVACFTVERDVWDRYRRAGKLAWLLSAIESDRPVLGVHRWPPGGLGGSPPST